MPDDNSCMFTAFGGVLQRADPAPTLRREVAEYILAHPDKFDKVVLEMDPERYARTIRDPDRWGGAIELSIFSDIYDIEICSVDVKVYKITPPSPQNVRADKRHGTWTIVPTGRPLWRGKSYSLLVALLRHSLRPHRLYHGSQSAGRL